MQEALSKFKKGAYAVDPVTEKVGKVIADPDGDHEVKLIFADKSKSSFVKVTKIAQASKEQVDKYAVDCRVMQEALSKFKKGTYAVDPGTKKVGKVIADPNSDGDVKLIFADKTKSGWLKVTKIAQASKEQADKYDSDAA
jgi:hypothetical protein